MFIDDSCPDCGRPAIIARYSNHIYCNRCHPEENKHSEYVPFDFGRNGYVYFIRSETGPIKIGFARVPERRLRSIQAMSPVSLDIVATEPGVRHRECQLHWRFRESRLHGEWFEPTLELKEYIKSLRGAGRNG